MPPDSSILGFTNKWYAEGLRHAESVDLGNGVSVKIFSLPYFIASKISAFLGRGGRDYRLSKDIEDLISVMDGRDDFSRDVDNFPSDVSKFFKENLRKFMKDSLFRESMYCLGYGPEVHERVIALHDTLDRILN